MTAIEISTAPSGLADAEQALVEAALDALIASHDPHTTDPTVFRGARYDHGLAWVQFPKGVGGLGVHAELNRLVELRLRDTTSGAHPAPPFIRLIGPTIAVWGSDDQKQRFLRPMYTGEDRWCQLFSEPGAGSDFAGLACRSVRDGDEWIVNGQKVWNTLAHRGDWGMLVTRSNPEAPKHKGMTYFVVDMRSPGLEVRPLRQITGEAEFNEVYLTDVHIPDTNRIGPVDEGWRVSLTTLTHEHTPDVDNPATARALRGGFAIDAVATWKNLDDKARTPVRRDELMRLWVRGEVARLSQQRTAAAAQLGNPGPVGSIGKLVIAELKRDVYEFCVTIKGATSLIGFDYSYRRPEMIEATDTSRGTGYAFLRARATTIEGGTSEIMRNILGEQVLGLPSEPRIDKELPWSKVPRS